MTDYLMPFVGRVARSTFRYIDSTGMSLAVNTNAVRTATLGGDRLGAMLELTSHAGMHRALVLGFLKQLRGKQNRAILMDHAAQRRGSFPAPELVPNGRFVNSTGWASSADYSLLVTEGVLRTQRVGADGSRVPLYINSTLPTTSGAAYAARFMVHPGRGTFANGYRIDAGTTVNTNGIVTGATVPAFGLATQVFTASGAAATVRLVDLAAENITDYLQIPYVSVSRCILVNGASQTGSGLNVDNLPVSTNGLLLTDDIVEVITNKGSELKYATAPLNSDSGGAGYLQFEPPLRGVPADNAPIIINLPLGRFICVTNLPSWVNDPGVFTTTSFDFEEATSP